VYEAYVDEGEITRPTGAENGPSRIVHAGALPAGSDIPFDNAGCNDNAGGWWLWIASKFATGAKPFPGMPFGWKGIYQAIADFGVQSGHLIPEAAELPATVGKFAGPAAALINVAMFLAQIADRHAEVTMDGTGPLIRTKTTSHGSARTITIAIAYGGGNDEQVQKRNCIFAALGAIGNTAQQALGSASNVEVEVSGGAGFANSLDPTGSIVLFGPATFHPVQTADANGTITVPVQGRAQRSDLPDTAKPVEKEFSIIAEASLDPVTASTIGRSFADDLMCLGTAGSGTADAIVECQNALIDIIKQFHWDLGEYTFPLTDWTPPGWYIDEAITENTDIPLQIAGSSCDSELGEWIISITGSGGGMSIYSDITVTFEPDGTGMATLDWSGGGGGVSFQGGGTMAAELTPEGDGYLISFVPGSFTTTVSAAGLSHAFGDRMTAVQVHVKPAPEGMCG